MERSGEKEVERAGECMALRWLTSWSTCLQGCCSTLVQSSHHPTSLFIFVFYLLMFSFDILQLLILNWKGCHASHLPWCGLGDCFYDRNVVFPTQLSNLLHQGSLEKLMSGVLKRTVLKDCRRLWHGSSFWKGARSLAVDVLRAAAEHCVKREDAEMIWWDLFYAVPPQPLFFFFPQNGSYIFKENAKIMRLFGGA